MDVFSHGLWAGALAKGSNSFKQTKLNPFLAAWWGVFPDVFAFAIPMIWLVVSIINGSVDPALLRGTRSEEPPAVFQTSYPVFQLAPHLYNISHSLIIFGVVVGVIFLIRTLRTKGKNWKQLIPWEMFGWLLHIICDIPTHTPQFYPTPLFWPLSSWKFTYGFSWGQPWFLAIDYGLLILFFIVLAIKKRRTSSYNHYDHSSQ